MLPIQAASLPAVLRSYRRTYARTKGQGSASFAAVCRRFASRTRLSTFHQLLVLSLSYSTPAMSRFFLLAVLASLLFSLVSADIPADLIASLPGYGKTPTKQYSGFLPVDANQTLFLHYWFVTSSNQPSTDPVAVWMNGGPGCSSIGGFLTELGPFSFTGDKDAAGIPTLQDNPYGWTTVSSVLFLEQPAGVGYSYAVNGSSASDDFIQSQNTYGFLLNWFKAFPEYSKNDFFITGESYAGIYVPTLANRILDGNAAGNAYINLKGIAVGDGCMGNSIGTCGDGPDALQIEFDLFYGHGMISESAKESVYELCGNWINISQDCQMAAEGAIENVGNINIYDGQHTQPINTHTTLTTAPRTPT